MQGKTAAPPPQPGHGGEMYGRSDYPPPGQQQPQQYEQPQQYSPQQHQQPQWQQPSGVVVQGQPVGAPQQVQPRQPGTTRCGTITALVFIVIYMVGCLVGIGGELVVIESDTQRDFRGAITHWKFKTNTYNMNIRIGQWDSVGPLEDMRGGIRASAAMLFLGLFLALFLMTIQIMRLCKKLKTRRIYTHLTATSSVIIALFSLIQLSTLSSTLSRNLPHLIDWILVNLRLHQAHTYVGGAYAALVLLVYLPAIILLAFGIRTWVGAKCNECCCECCICALADDKIQSSSAHQGFSDIGNNV